MNKKSDIKIDKEIKKIKKRLSKKAIKNHPLLENDKGLTQKELTLYLLQKNKIDTAMSNEILNNKERI